MGSKLGLAIGKFWVGERSISSWGIWASKISSGYFVGFLERNKLGIGSIFDGAHVS
jgi:hypothetical protein